MKKLATTLITLTAIGVAVKVMKDKKNKKIVMYQIFCKSKEDGLNKMKRFLNQNNYKYLCHEIEEDSVYFLYEN